MSTWILVVSWLAMSQSYQQRGDRAWGEVTMQEFNTLEACQFASVEVQKITPQVRVVCVPKGVK